MSTRLTAVVGVAVLSLAAMGGLAALDSKVAVNALANAMIQPADPAEMKRETYDIDGGHSSVMFRIKHLNVAYFYGRFNKMSGSFVWDPADPTKSSIEMTIPADSVDTNSKGRDDHVKNEDFFDVEKYPEITFKSTTVTPISETKFKVEGDLTFRDVTKAMAVDVDFTGAGSDPWGGFRAGLETTFTFKRSDFGMDFLLGALGDEIKVMASLEGVRRKE